MPPFVEYLSDARFCGEPGNHMRKLRQREIKVTEPGSVSSGI